jgi:hypothetical protein
MVDLFMVQIPLDLIFLGFETLTNKKKYGTGTGIVPIVRDLFDRKLHDCKNAENF